MAAVCYTQIMNKLRLIILTIILAISAVPVLAQNQQELTEGLKLLQTAYTEYQDGKYEQALADCAKALAIDPKDRRAYILEGYVYAAQGKLTEASDAVAKAIKLDPKDQEVILLKGEYDYRRGAKDEALKNIRKAIELDPKYAEAHFMLGKLLGNTVKDQDKAIAAYETALSFKPQFFEAHVELARIYEFKNQPTKAEESYRKSIALDPKHAAGRFNLGRILLKQNRLEEARKLWDERTSDEDNMRPTFITQLQWAENLKRTTEAVAERPNDPAALADLGFATMEGPSWVIDLRQERAIVQFKKALELKPDFARAQYGIVKAYIELANFKDDYNKNVDGELAKLQKLDPKLAAEMTNYRNSFRGELIGSPVKPD